jgi:hypothetical protein
MKKSVKTLVVFGCTFAVSATLFGQALPTFTFDENGKGNINGSSFPSFVGPDPSGGVTANVLIYQLPFQVVSGDVALVEPNQPTGVYSDLVRFFTPAGANQSLLIFYSDIEAGDPLDLADSRLPVAPNAIPIPEVGPENNNGAVWTPTPGLPGSSPTGAPVQYNIISDVPEPASAALCGLGLLFVVNRFRRNGVLNGELKSMKKSVKTLVVFGCTFAVSATLFGQALPTITFDENGKGNINGSPLPSTVAPDPSGGIAANVLIYQLPFQVVPGDVALVEPNQPTGVYSDLVRFFTPAAGGPSLLIFYSDVEPGGTLDLADTGLPVAPNAIPIPEVGPENSNGAVWNPAPGMPGSTSAPVQYNIISDVPEPASAALSLCGLSLLFVVNRFRRNGALKS